MSREISEPIDDHLRAIRGSVDRMEHDIKDLKFPAPNGASFNNKKSRLTRDGGQIEHTLAQHGTTLAHYTSRFDRIDDRLEHIEKRLGLMDA